MTTNPPATPKTRIRKPASAAKTPAAPKAAKPTKAPKAAKPKAEPKAAKPKAAKAPKAPKPPKAKKYVGVPTAKELELKEVRTEPKNRLVNMEFTNGFTLGLLPVRVKGSDVKKVRDVLVAWLQAHLK